MSITTIILVLLVGIVGGVSGSIIVIESKTSGLYERISLLEHELHSLAKYAENTKNETEVLNLAMQKLITQFQQARSGIWQSLNDLWIDYDERHGINREESEDGEH